MKVDILGVKVDKVKLQQALKKVEGFLLDGQKHYIVTPNPEIVVAAQKDGQLRQILNQADLAIPDGIGLIWASRRLAQKISNIKYQKAKILRERVTGVDLMEEICQIAQTKGLTVGLLGGKGETAQKTAQALQIKFPKLNVIVFKENIPIVKKTDILFVAMGAPRQEKWIWQNLPKIPTKIAIGVGGAFEMISGIQRRAPNFIQNLGAEWLWRLTLQPWRIKRQLALPFFVFLVLKQRVK